MGAASVIGLAGCTGRANPSRQAEGGSTGTPTEPSVSTSEVFGSYSFEEGDLLIDLNSAVDSVVLLKNGETVHRAFIEPGESIARMTVVDPSRAMFWDGPYSLGAVVDGEMVESTNIDAQPNVEIIDATLLANSSHREVIHSETKLGIAPLTGEMISTSYAYPILTIKNAGNAPTWVYDLKLSKFPDEYQKSAPPREEAFLARTAFPRDPVILDPNESGVYTSSSIGLTFNRDPELVSKEYPWPREVLAGDYCLNSLQFVIEVVTPTIVRNRSFELDIVDSRAEITPSTLEYVCEGGTIIDGF